MMQKMTQSRGNEELVAGSPCSFGEFFRQRMRTRSNTSTCSDENSNSYELFDIDESEGYESASSPLSPYLMNNNSNGSTSMPIQINPPSSKPMAIPFQPRVARNRNESCCLDSAFSNDEALSFFNSRNANKQRPSCVMAEKNYIAHKKDHLEEEDEDEDECYSSIRNRFDFLDEEESTLGKIHLELCKYHEMGRFLTSEIEEFNQEAAFFHLKQAANLGVIEALNNTAKIYLQLPHDILPNFQVEVSLLNDFHLIKIHFIN